MQDITGDLFATKGLEYILVIGYLALLVLCWRFVRPRSGRSDATESDGTGLFELPDGLHFHQGHAWARSNGDAIMRVGMDDFACRLLGTATGLDLPEVGARLTAGEPGWHVTVDGHRIPVIAPVDGKVAARNESLLGAPEALVRAPYQDGWVVDVAVPNPQAAARNLLSGSVARAWRDQVIDRLRQLADGDDITGSGERAPGTGLARAIDPDDWAEVARAFLLTDGAPTDGVGADGVGADGVARLGRPEEGRTPMDERQAQEA